MLRHLLIHILILFDRFSPWWKQPRCCPGPQLSSDRSASSWDSWGKVHKMFLRDLEMLLHCFYTVLHSFMLGQLGKSNTLEWLYVSEGFGDQSRGFQHQQTLSAINMALHCKFGQVGEVNRLHVWGIWRPASLNLSINGFILLNT